MDKSSEGSAINPPGPSSSEADPMAKSNFDSVEFPWKNVRNASVEEHMKPIALAVHIKPAALAVHMKPIALAVHMKPTVLASKSRVDKQARDFVTQSNFIDFLEVKNSGEKEQGPVVSLQFGNSFNIGVSVRTKNFILEPKRVVVDFSNEAAMRIASQRKGGKPGLQVLSLITMPGIGKTTMAREMYSNPYIEHHFRVRAFMNVSKNSCIDSATSAVLITDQIKEMNCKELCESLYGLLKGQRYLVIVNDVQDIDLWRYFEKFFPDDNNRSRIVLTTRHLDVAMCVEPLTRLTVDESWDFLQKKVFGKENCPEELCPSGHKIAAKCHGLPVAIVVMAEFLGKEEKTRYLWEQVALGICSYVKEILLPNSLYDYEPCLQLSYIKDIENSLQHEYVNEEIKMIINKVVKKHLDKTICIGTKPVELPAYESSLTPITQNLGETTVASGSSKKRKYQITGQTVKGSPNMAGEYVVGFDHEAGVIKEQLVGQQRLKVVSIVGMAGLGKTTLARKLYTDPFIEYHFYVRGWTRVSQAYTKRDCLLDIFHSAFQLRDQVCGMRDERLGEELHKRLKGHRYLIVLDDIWNNEPWLDLKISFPDDNNGSRILFTSRMMSIAFSAAHTFSYFLRFLTQDESWELLQRKIFGKVYCPPELVEIGKQIAANCMGLPLSIVVIAGLLAKTEEIHEWWSQVADRVGSHIVGEPNQCMTALELSYSHLPLHLKPCFLYCGAFLENSDIPVSKLISLWIAEGFIPQIKHKSMEDIAHDYLMDMVDRSLLLVTRRRYNGAVRACRLHDLLRDLCLKKADEENFILRIKGYEQLLSFSGITKKQCLWIHSEALHFLSLERCAYHVHSLLCFGPRSETLPVRHASAIFQTLSHLRVLDFSSIPLILFSEDILQLVNLQYLGLQIKEGSLPASISNLRRLETLLVSTRVNVTIPQTIWKMKKLKHLLFPAGENVIERPDFEITKGYPSSLDNLLTISQIGLSSYCQDVLERTPKLKKLVFCGPLMSEFGNVTLPDMDFLNHLETLRFLDTNTHARWWCNLQWEKFPPNLRRLTLSNTDLRWGAMTLFGMLPNLELLKLKFHACVGKQWKTTDGGFQRLKVLKIIESNIMQWEASSAHFPRLEHLTLQGCNQLQEVPSGLGHIDTLRIIELRDCSSSAARSVRQLQLEKQSNGDDRLSILITPPKDL